MAGKVRAEHLRIELLCANIKKILIVIHLCAIVIIAQPKRIRQHKLRLAVAFARCYHAVHIAALLGKRFRIAHAKQVQHFFCGFAVCALRRHGQRIIKAERRIVGVFVRPVQHLTRAFCGKRGHGAVCAFVNAHRFALRAPFFKAQHLHVFNPIKLGRRGAAFCGPVTIGAAEAQQHPRCKYKRGKSFHDPSSFFPSVI